jgi:Ribonuclease G/E
VELQTAMQQDRARCSALPISEFGLAQMTRHRVRDDLGRRMTVPCASCGGEGKHRAPEVTAYDVLRAIDAVTGSTPQGTLVVKCAPQVISWLGEHERGAVPALEARLGARVRLEGNRDMEDRWSVGWTGA